VADRDLQIASTAPSWCVWTSRLTTTRPAAWLPPNRRVERQPHAYRAWQEPADGLDSASATRAQSVGESVTADSCWSMSAMYEAERCSRRPSAHRPAWHSGRVCHL